MGKGQSYTSLGIAVLLGLGTGIGAYTFYYAKGLSYLSTDPKACANCHVMQDQFDGWQKSSHHTAAVCADCHMPAGFFAKYLTKAENGFLHSKAFTLQNYLDPIQIRDSSKRILNGACLKCHGDMVDGITHQSGADAEDLTDRCTKCHDSVGH